MRSYKLLGKYFTYRVIENTKTKTQSLWSTRPILHKGEEKRVIPDRNPLGIGFTKKPEYKNKYSKYVCPLHVPGHVVNLCKVIQEQAKYIKSTWSTTR